MRLSLLLRNSFSFTYPCPRKLREIVKLSMFERETSDSIASIWKDYHLNRPENISDTLTLP